ncbi:MAG: hypothetical protein JW901_05405 [Dehalococcoidia bacterium]|nr:hypothetical protein [Dehalococcoidia bacterium]
MDILKEAEQIARERDLNAHPFDLNRFLFARRGYNVSDIVLDEIHQFDTGRRAEVEEIVRKFKLPPFIIRD